MAKICFFIASKLTKDTRLHAIIRTTATQLARNQHNIIMGGMSTGHMEIAGKTFLKHGGHATIIYPTCYACNQESLEHTNLTHIRVPDISQRVGMMYATADACITFPGGHGTLHELAQVNADNQACIPMRPIKPQIVYNHNGFYDGLIMQLNRCHNDGYISEEDMQLVRFTSNWKEIIPLLESTLPLAA